MNITCIYLYIRVCIYNMCILDMCFLIESLDSHKRIYIEETGGERQGERERTEIRRAKSNANIIQFSEYHYRLSLTNLLTFGIVTCQRRMESQS